MFSTTLMTTRKLLFKFAIFSMVLVTVTFFAYYDALYNGFLTWDTNTYVMENEHIKSLSAENLWWMLTAFHASNWHPLTWLSHALDYALYGLDPWGHHLTSIVLHCLNTLLLFILTIVLLSVNQSPQSTTLKQIDNKILFIAAITALLFGIHPQHVESVAWIAERKDVLCLFFILLTFISYSFYTQAHTARPRYYFATLICFLLALSAKPMAVTVPVILLLLDIYPLHRTTLTTSVASSVPYRYLVGEKLPFFALSLFSSIITLFAQQTAMSHIAIEIRFFNAFNSFFMYIVKLCFPINLLPFYPLPSLSSFHEHYWMSFMPIVAFGLITLLGGYLWYKKLYFWLSSWLFYIITLSPMIGIIQVGSQAFADRYAYLPTLPFYLMISMGIVKLYSQAKFPLLSRLGTTVLSLLLVVTLVYLTQKQTFIWKHDVIFWNYIALQVPNNLVVELKLGEVAFLYKDYQKAAQHYENVSRLDFRQTIHYAHFIASYVHLGKLQDAIDLYKHALDYKLDIEQSPDTIYYNIALLYSKQGKHKQAQEALQQALAINPHHTLAKELLESNIIQ